MQEVVLEENRRIKAGGNELGMKFLGNRCGFERDASFHGFVEFLG